MSPNKGERIFYLRDARNQPVACVAYSDDNGTVSYALAVLHPDDQFNRTLAREIALGRLRSKPFLTLATHERPFMDALDSLAGTRHEGVPRRIQQLAKEWVS